jgi:hypothetical protein
VVPVRGDEEVVRGRYGQRGVSLPMAILETVGRATDQGIERLPPLYPGIDPDCIERLFDGEPAHATPDLSLTFPYAGVLVTVRGDGEIVVSCRGG